MSIMRVIMMMIMQQVIFFLTCIALIVSNVNASLLINNSHNQKPQQPKHQTEQHSYYSNPAHVLQPEHVSNFRYSEGRKFNDYAIEDLAAASSDELQSRAFHSSSPTSLLNVRRAAAPQVVSPSSSLSSDYNGQHIYKRSSALISGPHYPQLLSGAQLSLSRRPMSRRMMSSASLQDSADPMYASDSISEQAIVSAPSDLQQQPFGAANEDSAAMLLRQKQLIQYHDQWISAPALTQSTFGKCHKRTLNFCASVLPFNSTIFPNIIGDTSRFDVKRSLPFFGFLAKSLCNKRLDELLCLLLEPPCNSRLGEAIPPCKKFCRLALEGCSEYIPATLALSSVFDCRQYPESSDPNVCVNLAQGSKCADDEFRCPDKTCIPNHWVCDGVRDCEFAADEANCSVAPSLSVCSTEEFQCDGKCIPKAWKCDGERDCLDGSDEESCDDRPKCGSDRFKCHDGNGCLPRRWVCDGKAECRDGSDEVNCLERECSESDFKCDNGICVPKIWRCDNQFDCKDKSDERDCPNNLNSIYHLAFPPMTNASAIASFEASKIINSAQQGIDVSGSETINFDSSFVAPVRPLLAITTTLASTTIGTPTSTPVTLMKETNSNESNTEHQQEHQSVQVENINGETNEKQPQEANKLIASQQSQQHQARVLRNQINQEPPKRLTQSPTTQASNAADTLAAVTSNLSDNKQQSNKPLIHGHYQQQQDNQVIAQPSVTSTKFAANLRRRIVCSAPGAWKSKFCAGTSPLSPSQPNNGNHPVSYIVKLNQTAILSRAA